MNAEDTIKLARFVRAACPQQKFDEYTADAWRMLLADIDYRDAMTATQTLAKRQPFVSPAEIIGEVKRIRADRLARHGNAEPADADPDDPHGYRRAIGAYRKGIADGRVEPTDPPLSIEGQKRVAEIVDRCAMPDDVRRKHTDALAEYRRKKAAEDAARAELKAQRRLAIEAARAELDGSA